MADQNPFDQFDKPAANPFDQFDKPTTPAPSTPAGYQSPSWLPGAGWLHKMSNIFDDSATLGAIDPATAKVGDLLRSAGIANTTPDVATLRAQTGQNRADVGPLASAAADIAGYAVGPGTIGIGEKLAGLGGGKLLARMGGSAAENALAAGGGTLGHGGSLGDAGQAATVGGLIGAATGALPGGRGPRPDTPSTADLQNTASNLYAPLRNQPQDPRAIGDAISNVTSGMDVGDASLLGSKVADARDLMSRNLGNAQMLTSDSVAKLQRALKEAAGGDSTKQRIVKQYTDALDKTVGPFAASNIASANRASNIAQTSGEIGDWLKNLSLAPSAVKRALENKPFVYKTQPGLFDALSAIGKKAPSTDSSISSEVGKAVGKHLLGAAIGGGVGYALGNNPYGDLATTALGAAAPMTFGRLARIPTRNALLAAQHLNATGLKVDPGVYTNSLLQGFGALARQGGYAAGAVGAF